MTGFTFSPPVRLSLLLALALLVSGTALAAAPCAAPPEAALLAGPPLALPEDAVRLSPDVYYLGARLHYGQVVQGYALLQSCTSPDERSEEGHDRVPMTAALSRMGVPSPAETLEDAGRVLLNPGNRRELDHAYLLRAIRGGVSARMEITGVDVAGTGELTALPLLADLEDPDGLNEIYLGSLAEPDALAMVVVWGTFTAPLGHRHVVEWDLVLSEDVAWSLDGRPGTRNVGDAIVCAIERILELVTVNGAEQAAARG